MNYVVLIEPAADGSCSSYVPDLPGCVACADSIDEARHRIAEAVKLHIKSLKEHGEPVPPPSVLTHTIRIPNS